MSKTKVCTKCNIRKPLDKFYRRRSRSGVWVKHGQCKKCINEKTRKNYATQKASDLRKLKLKARNYYLKNQERIKQRNKIRYKNDKKYRLRLRKYLRQWRLDHPTESSEMARSYARKNKERLSKAAKRWRANNPLKSRAIAHRRRTIIHRSGDLYNDNQWNKLVLYYCFDAKCLCCKKARKLTVDHVIPLSSGGRNTINNLQPLCLHCNSSKGTKTIDYRFDHGEFAKRLAEYW